MCDIRGLIVLGGIHSCLPKFAFDLIVDRVAVLPLRRLPVNLAPGQLGGLGEFEFQPLG